MTRCCLLVALVSSVVAFAQAPVADQALPASVAQPRSLGVTHGVERFEDSGQEVPGFHVERESRRAVWLPGIVLFGVAYGASVYLSLAAPPVRGEEALPLVGVFLLAGKLFQQSRVGEFGGFTGMVGVFAVILGVAQVTGVTMAVLGFALPKTWLERDAQVSVSVGPGGLAVAGQF
jgi:hypothetical protein